MTVDAEEIAAFVFPTEATREETEEVIKAWRVRREERYEADRVAKNLKEKENQLSSWLLEVFKQQKFEGMLIGGRITGLNAKSVPVVEDKEQFCKYILEEEALELLQFRISTSAIQEREENGVSVPGIEHIEVYDLFDRKA